MYTCSHSPPNSLPSRLPHNIEQSSMCCTVGPWLSILNLWRQPLVCSLSLTKWLLKVKLCSKPSRPCYLTQRKMCKSLNSLCMLSCFNWVQPFVALGTVACQASLSIGFSRQENWSAFQCPLPGDLPYPGIKPTSLAVPALQADSLPLSHWGSPLNSLLLLLSRFSRVRLCATP